MVNKQNTVDNLLNKHHIYMCRNSNKPGKIFNKNTNAQPVQINATAEKRFQTQKRNNLTVKNNTYYTESDAERRPSEWRTQQHRDIEKRSINTIEKQLIEFRQKQQEKFSQIKKSLIYQLIRMVGDSMLSGIEERRISKRDRKVKV